MTDNTHTEANSANANSDSPRSFLGAMFDELARSPEKIKERIANFHLVDTVNDMLGAAERLLAPHIQGSADNAAVRTIAGFAFVNGLIAGLPLPFPDMPVLTAIEIIMVQRLASIHGIELSIKEAATRLLAVMGVFMIGFVMQALGLAAHGVLKFVGLGAGAPVSFVLVFALTYGLGVITEAALAGRENKRPTLAALAAIRQGGKLAVTVFRNVLDAAVWQEMKGRFVAGISGRSYYRVVDSAAVTAGMVALAAGDNDYFDTAPGTDFWQAASRAVPEWEHLDPTTAGEELSQLSPAQLQGYHNLIKGEIFEQAVVAAENADGDAVNAEQFGDRTHPDTDLVYVNSDTGQSVELSLKATDNDRYVLHALERYPDSDVLVTHEVATDPDLADNDRVIDSGMDNADLDQQTATGLHEMMEDSDTVDATEAAALGLGLAALIAAAPALYQAGKGAISQEEAGRQVADTLRRKGGKLAAYAAAGAVGLGPLALVYASVRSSRFVLGFLSPFWREPAGQE